MTTTELAANKVASILDRAAKPRVRDIRRNGETEQYYRQMVAFAPKGYAQNDINDPETWDGSKLQVDDHVYLIAEDEKGRWSIDLICVWTDGKDALLEMNGKIHRNTRMDPLPSDDNYQVIHRDNGYAVQRRKDLVIMNSGLATKAAAVRALDALYPKKVG
jgi:hypothetical protein